MNENKNLVEDLKLKKPSSGLEYSLGTNQQEIEITAVCSCLFDNFIASSH